MAQPFLALWPVLFDFGHELRFRATLPLCGSRKCAHRIGTKGYIELRKYVDMGQQLDQPARENNVYIATQDGEEQHQVTGKIGFPFFGALILDCIERTELAMSQKHCFTAAAICLQAQQMADLDR